MPVAAASPTTAARGFGARPAAARAAGAVALLALAACVIPPKPLAPNPAGSPATPPAVSTWSPSAFPGTTVLPSLYFSADRDAYASVFEVDRNGRVRVVYPATPRQTGRIEAGRSYVATSRGIGTDRTFINLATNWRRLPFMFVVVSDARPDLSAFGNGREWRSQVRAQAVDAEDVIEAVAQDVTAKTNRPFTTDFTYLGPRLSVGEAFLAAQCARPAANPQDYWYYRDLWAVFTPEDPTLGVSPFWAYSSAVAWSRGTNLPLALARLQLATNVFWGGCGGNGFQTAPNSFLFASRGLWGSGYAVLSGPGVVQVVPTDAGRQRVQPPPGAQPEPLRVPRTPLGFVDAGATGASGRVERAGVERVGRLEPLDVPDAPGSLAGRAAFQAGARGGSVERAGGGLVVEPLDRPVLTDAGGRAEPRAEWRRPGWTTDEMGGRVRTNGADGGFRDGGRVAVDQASGAAGPGGGGRVEPVSGASSREPAVTPTGGGAGVRPSSPPMTDPGSAKQERTQVSAPQ